jgi:hypothetical protein
VLLVVAVVFIVAVVIVVTVFVVLVFVGVVVVVTLQRGRRDPVLPVMGVVVTMSGAVAGRMVAAVIVLVIRRIDHRRDREGRDQRGDDGHRHTGEEIGSPRQERTGADDGAEGQECRDGVGRLRPLRLLEAGDPRDPGEAGVQPAGERCEVDGHERTRCDACARSEEGEHRRTDLRDRDQDEQSRETHVLGVDADGSGVNHPGADRGERSEQERAGRSVGRGGGIARRRCGTHRTRVGGSEAIRDVGALTASRSTSVESITPRSVEHGGDSCVGDLVVLFLGGTGHADGAGYPALDPHRHPATDGDQFVDVAGHTVQQRGFAHEDLGQ